MNMNDKDKEKIKKEFINRCKNAVNQGFEVKKITPQYSYPFKFNIKLRLEEETK